jgi:hypothetical protein
LALGKILPEAYRKRQNGIPGNFLDERCLSENGSLARFIAPNQ